jgi:hypothetical protein
MKVRSVVVLAFLLSLVASSAFAQPMLTYGAKGGVTLANISIEDDDECCDMKVGGAFGGFVDIGINDRVSIQPELLFAMKGAKDEEFGQTAKINVNYIDIPILVKGKFPTGGRVQPFITVGPSMNFRLSAKIKEGGQEDDIKDEVESLDFSVVLGGGIAVGPATVEARYDLGLKDVDKESGSVKTRTILVLVGFGVMR